MKRCRRCGLNKLTSMFHAEPRNRDGIKAFCKECAYQVTREWYRRLRDGVLHHYSGGHPACACCGATDLLELDHIDGGGNAKRKEMGESNGSWFRKLIQAGFPPGYQVLCRTCNRSKANTGACRRHSGKES